LVDLLRDTGIVEKNLKVEKPYRMWWIFDEEVNFRVMKVDVDVAQLKDYALKKKLCC
jgi:hypothetical protein